MSLSLAQNAYATAINLVTSFQASGGTPPYVYSVLPLNSSGLPGAGGTINASTGDYTSPSTTGQDIIQVEDSLGAIATASILVCNALELVCDIIQRELGLADGRVYLWDQKINQPKDQGMFVVVQVLTSKPFASNSYMDNAGPGVDQVQTVNMYANLSIDILSRGPEARDRKEEIIMALRSVYSQQQQTANSFYIAQISNAFINLSQLDGAAIPYRFNISVAVQYMVTKRSAIPYFDSFTDAAVTTEP